MKAQNFQSFQGEGAKKYCELLAWGEHCTSRVYVRNFHSDFIFFLMGKMWARIFFSLKVLARLFFGQKSGSENLFPTALSPLEIKSSMPNPI